MFKIGRMPRKLMQILRELLSLYLRLSVATLTLIYAFARNYGNFDRILGQTKNILLFLQKKQSTTMGEKPFNP